LQENNNYFSLINKNFLLSNYASRPVRPTLGNMSYLHDRDTPLPKPGSQTMTNQLNETNEKITSGLTIEVKSPEMKNNS